MAFGSFVLQRNLTFEVRPGDIFVIMGGSGCGKSTLLRHMLGLIEPSKGEIWYGETNFTKADDATRDRIVRGMGVLYQTGALWSSMTLAENVALPLEEFGDLAEREITEIVSLKLSLVGLSGFEEYYPSQISGGMQKRAGLARAMALDPDILFFDEPSAGLDPISARRLDDLILELRESLGTSIVVVTHELARRCLSSSLPCLTTGFMPKIDRCTAEQPFIAAPDAAISSRINDASVMPWPPPPYASGMATPIQPPSASAS
jgi:phospholipid/cholesterol/gamma-HCH transport system ATP-binding protein